MNVDELHSFSLDRGPDGLWSLGYSVSASAGGIIPALVKIGPMEFRQATEAELKKAAKTFVPWMGGPK